jgi:hypothetical protein
MSITFAIEARTDDEAQALAVEDAPSLNVHHGGGYRLLRTLGIEPDCCGTIDAAELLARIDNGPRHPVADCRETYYVTERLPLLRNIAVAAERVGRRVVWA